MKNLYEVKNFISILGDMELAVKYLVVENKVTPEEKFYILDCLREIEKIIFMSREKVLKEYFNGDENEL